MSFSILPISGVYMPSDPHHFTFHTHGCVLPMHVPYLSHQSGLPLTASDLPLATCTPFDLTCRWSRTPHSTGSLWARMQSGSYWSQCTSPPRRMEKARRGGRRAAPCRAPSRRVGHTTWAGTITGYVDRFL